MTESDISPRPLLPGPDSSPELYEVNRKSWKYRRKYLVVCLTHPFSFFWEIPIAGWSDLLRSTHEVADATAVFLCALENQSDMWVRSALEQRFVEWNLQKRVEVLQRPAVKRLVEANDVARMTQLTYVDLWDAYVAGAKSGQKHPEADESCLNRAADGYCKLIHSTKDPEHFAAMGRGDPPRPS
jgi:hypothetical protein